MTLRKYLIIKRTRLSCCRMIWLLPYPVPPHPQPSVSLALSSCVSPVELTDGRGERWWRRSQSIRRRDSLVLYKRETYTFELLYTTQVLRWNSRTNSWVEVSGHNLESS